MSNFLIIMPVYFEGESTHDFCMAFAQCTNEFGLTLMQRPITITSKSDLKSKAKVLVTILTVRLFENFGAHSGALVNDSLDKKFCNRGRGVGRLQATSPLQTSLSLDSKL